MPHYLDPKNDLTFKRVFGEHKHLCMSLINSLLPLDNPVVSLEYQSGEIPPPLAFVMRNTIVDVRCTDSAGRQFIVEMQMHWTDGFKRLVLFNASKAYVMQLGKAGCSVETIANITKLAPAEINKILNNSQHG